MDSPNDRDKLPLAFGNTYISETIELHVSSQVLLPSSRVHTHPYISTVPTNDGNEHRFLFGVPSFSQKAGETPMVERYRYELVALIFPKCVEVAHLRLM